MIESRNFACFEQQPLAVTGSNSQGSFTTVEGQNAKGCLVANYGSAGVQLKFGPTAQTAVVTASAAGTKQYYIPAGAVMTIEKGSGALFFAAITDTGTTNLILMAGEGS